MLVVRRRRGAAAGPPHPDGRRATPGASLYVPATPAPPPGPRGQARGHARASSSPSWPRPARPSGPSRSTWRSCSPSPPWPASASGSCPPRLASSCPFLAFAVFLPARRRRTPASTWPACRCPSRACGRRGTSSPRAPSACSPSIVLAGHDARRRPAARASTGCACRARVRRHRRVHGPLPRRHRRRGRAHARRPPSRGPTTPAGSGRPGPSRHRPGTLFIRSYERGERVHLAMLSAGLRRHHARPRRAHGDVAGDWRRRRRPARWRRPRWRSPAWWCAVTAPPVARRARSVASPIPTAARRCAASTCDVEAGERVAVLGPNGAGKTTLVLHLNGILTPAGGHGDGGRAAGHRATARRPARSGAASASSSRTPTTSCSCPRCATTSPSGPPTSACAATRSTSASTRPCGAVGMEGSGDRAPHHLSLGQRRRVAVATVLAMQPDGPRARRADVQPRPGGPARAGRRAHRPRPADGDRHPRPALRPRAVPACRWCSTREPSSPTGRPAELSERHRPPRRPPPRAALRVPPRADLTATASGS